MILINPRITVEEVDKRLNQISGLENSTAQDQGR